MNAESFQKFRHLSLIKHCPLAWLISGTAPILQTSEHSPVFREHQGVPSLPVEPQVYIKADEEILVLKRDFWKNFEKIAK